MREWRRKGYNKWQMQRVDIANATSKRVFCPGGFTPKTEEEMHQVFPFY